MTAGLEAFFTATAPAELSALASSRSAAMLASVNGDGAHAAGLVRVITTPDTDM